MRQIAKKVLVDLLWTALGRNKLARFARGLTNAVRLDVPNNPKTNGEAIVQNVLLRWARRDRPIIVFDVGANVGEWTMALLKRCPEPEGNRVTVHAFEPCKATYDMLEDAVKGRERQVVTVFRGLSNSIGRATLNVVADGAGINSLYRRSDLDVVRREVVDLTTFDDYCRECALDYVTFLKIDVEGHDMAVLEGASGALERGAVDVIQFEYNRWWIESRHYLRDAFALLMPCGYRVGKITGKGIEVYKAWDPELESFREGNYLAWLEEWAERFATIRWWNET